MSTLTTLTEDKKRWLVYGIALNHVLVPSLRPILEEEIWKEYNFLKTNHGIDVQTSHSLPPKYPKANMKYQNINANDTKLKPRSYQVISHVDFAKLFLQNHMAKFNGFNESLDASAVLNLLGRFPVFSAALQKAADVVREGRNAWGHCNFTDWNEANFKTRFNSMRLLVKEVGLSPADESKVLADLGDWETKGVLLCMNPNATIDPELVKVLQEHVNELSCKVEIMSFETQELKNLKMELKNLKMELKKSQHCLHESVKRIPMIERDQEILQQHQSSIAVKVDQLTANQEVQQQEQNSIAVKVDQITANQELLKEQIYTAVKVEKQATAQKAVADLEGQTSPLDFSSCEADINYYAERYDPDTRQWLLEDFAKWFSKPSESRAFVLLGDAGVGKSVMAAVIAQRERDNGNLAAAYFCRHYDGTRRDPRYLLGSIAHELRNCNSEYDRLMEGDTGIQRILANNKLGVHELFTKLLEEPLVKCSSCERKLVVIDALDETEYLSREDFLDLIMNRFPQLPKWLVFFITSRPEDTVQFRLRAYHPCIKICSGNSDSADFNQKHEQDIQRFLENRIDFSKFSYSAEDLTKKSNGMFLYAFYVVEFVKNPTRLEEDIFPENMNDFFCQNFERVYKKIGSDFYKKLFGCVLVAPSPLPMSFISFMLHKENSALDEQEVIDTVSQFVAWRTSNKTFAFLHDLIPAWLTDKEKARRLFIDKNKANEYLRKLFVGFINGYLGEEKEIFSRNCHDLVDYVLRNGIHFLCNCSVESSDSAEIVFNCLTNYRFLQHRIQTKIGIYSLIEDFKLSIVRQKFNEKKKNILDDICLAIERDKYVVAGNAELLYSCLRNETKLSREDMMFSNVSTSWLELELDIAFSVDETLSDMKCGAFSHDRKLFAGGKDKCIYLYDASLFRKIFGPYKINSEDIVHLEFSPDDRYVFFGRLDSWFSVQEKRVVEITQFAGNSMSYNWGSFIDDGKYIALSQNITFKMHTEDCCCYIFYKWIAQEFDLEQENVHENMRRKFSYFCVGFLNVGEQLVRCFSDIEKHLERIKQQLCPSCAEFENLATPIHDRIIFLYADVFKGQIWNVHTGRPLMEEGFSCQVKLKPFFYLWHFFSVLSYGDFISEGSMTLTNVLFVNLVFSFYRKRQLVFDLPATNSRYSFVEYSTRMIGQRVKNLSHLLANSPVKFFNFILNNSRIILSKNGKWLASYLSKQIKLFEIKSDDKILLNCVLHLDCYLQEEWVAFTNDSNILVYFSHSENQIKTLRALSVHTGKILRSGIHPVPCKSADGIAMGYIFCGCDEEKAVLLRDLPGTFLCYLPSTKNPDGINVAFNSTDRIKVVYSNASYLSLASADGAWTTPRQCVVNVFSGLVCVKKCIFSSDGKLIAIHGSFDLLLFDGDKLPCSVFTVDENCENTITSIIFSPDDCLLLFFIQKGNGVLCFFVWDVKKRVLSGPIDIPLFMASVDCCCFSSDHTKLILCNASSVFILEDPPKFGRSSKHYDIPYVDHSPDHSCTHSTVSSDNKLLACCVANEILMFPLNGPNTFWKVIHSSRIEFCQFLKGNRYLISYGIDYVVILFDILEWKPVTYIRLQEPITSMAVSPDDEKAVCLKSSGDVSILKLHGLEYGLPSDFPLSAKFGLPERSHEPSRTQDRSHVPPERHIIVPPNQTAFKEDEMMSPDDFCEVSDGDGADEMYVESDHSEDRSDGDFYDIV